MTMPQSKKLFYLEDIAELQNGGAWKENEYADTGVCVVRVTDCQSGTIDLRSCKHLPITSFNKYSKHKLLSNDLVIATVGSHPTQPGSVVGRTSVVPQKASGALLNQNAVRVRAKNDILDQGFLNLFSKTEQFKNYIISHARGAANQVRMSLELLRKMPIELPPLPTQRRIASILSAYDDLIENNTRRIAILEEMARRLYEEWFVNFRFPGHETARFVETELGPVPEGWEVVALEDIANEVRDAVNPGQVHQDTPYVGLEHIPRRSITLCEWGTAANVNSSKLIFKKRDILFGKIRPYFHKVATAPIDGICSTDTILIRPKQHSFYSIVLCSVSSDAFVSHAVQTSNGTKMPRADWKVLKKYLVAFPKNGVLKRFNEVIVDAVEQTQNLMFKNANLRAQRDLLLPKLISGELDVSEA